MVFIKIMGPVSGFLLGAACNSLYHSLTRPVGLLPSDPRWIGAWWLGFMIISVTLFLPSLALFCFRSEQPTPDVNDETECAEGTNDADNGGERGKEGEDKVHGELYLFDKHKHQWELKHHESTGSERMKLELASE